LATKKQLPRVPTHHLGSSRKGESAKYLPPALNHEAWVLDDYGTWARVYYEGAYRYFWRPVHVGIGWAPFTVGRWTLWYGDHCWIPAERFGYVTHHYENWVSVKGIWHWAPPVVRARISSGPPFFNIGFAWYPGRVAWIHSGVHIGWVPLAPFEPYYSHHRWGRRSVVVKNVKTMNINMGINKYRYLNRAVIIQRDNLYRANNYKRIRIRTANNVTIMAKQSAAPVVANRIMSNYTKNKLSRPKTRRPAQVLSQRNIQKKILNAPRGGELNPFPPLAGFKKKVLSSMLNPNINPTKWSLKGFITTNRGQKPIQELVQKRFNKLQEIPTTPIPLKGQG